MDNKHTKELLQKQYNATFVSNINYNDKTYVKALKNSKNSIEYLYYEIDEDTIKEVTNKNLNEYFKKIYESPFGNIIY